LGRAAGCGPDAGVEAAASFILLFVMNARYSASLAIPCGIGLRARRFANEKARRFTLAGLLVLISQFVHYSVCASRHEQTGNP
jgi:hypothetical protein